MLDHAKEIVVKLGSLPLAIDQAGSYIAAHQISLSSYLLRYNNRRDVFSEKHLHETSDYSRGILTTWEISYDAIKSHNSLAATILDRCAFLGSENIIEHFLVMASKDKATGKFIF